MATDISLFDAADADARFRRDPANPSGQGVEAAPFATAVRDRALILGDDLGVFLAVARSLGRRGIDVHLIPARSDLPGLESRYVRQTHRLPSYTQDPGAWVEALRALIGIHDFGQILPCSDSDVHRLHRHAAEIGRGRLALPNDRAFAVFTDKGRTRALAAELGIPVAKGEVLGADAAPADLAARLGLPLVLKPRCSFAFGASRGKEPAEIARDGAALERALAGHRAQGWIAESFFPGEGVGLSVLAARGEVRLAWQHRRMREVSDVGPSTARVGEPVDPALLSHVEALTAASGLHGVAMFEFRRDPASGAHVLLEVNPRFWGSLPLAIAAGADFPALLWDLLTTGACSPGPVRRTGIVRASLTGEVDRIGNAMAASPAGRLKALAALWLLIGRCLFRSQFDSWAPDDPEPFRAERRLLARRVARALSSRLGVRKDRPQAR